jgi:hypothetical protein
MVLLRWILDARSSPLLFYATDTTTGESVFGLMTQTRLGKRTSSLGLVAARVLLGLEALGLMGIAVAFAYFQLAIAFLAASDTHDIGILWQGGWIGLALIGVGLIVGGAPLALTFARRRWAYFGLLAVELLLVLAFVLELTLAALQPAPVGLERETEIGRAIVLLFVLLPSSVCLLLLFRAEVREHFGL